MKIKKGMVVRMKCPKCGEMIVLKKHYFVTSIMRAIIYIIVSMCSLKYKNYLLLILALTSLQREVEFLTEADREYIASCNYCGFDRIIYESNINQDENGNIKIRF